MAADHSDRASDRERWRDLVQRTLAEAERMPDPRRQRMLRERAQDYMMRAALGLPYSPEHTDK